MYSTTQFSTTDHLILRSYCSILDGLAEFWGPGIEIVLHSLENYDSAAIKVVNGHYTGRSEGAPLTDLALRMLRDIQRSGNNHKNLIYSNKSKTGSPIRSATLPITGENDNIIGLLCINFYMDIPLHSYLESFILPAHSGNALTETFASSSDELIENAVLSARDEVYANPGISSTNRNREIISILLEKDIFRLKTAVPKVSEMLGLSTNTVYLHLRHLRAEKLG